MPFAICEGYFLCEEDAPYLQASSLLLLRHCMTSYHNFATSPYPPLVEWPPQVRARLGGCCRIIVSGGAPLSAATQEVRSPPRDSNRSTSWPSLRPHK